MSRVAVAGAGAWGTALAALLARRAEIDGDAAVPLWGRDADFIRQMRESGENARYLPGIPLPASLEPEADPARALADAETVLLVIPAQALRAACRELAVHLKPGATLVCCAKGIERETGRFASEIVAAELPEHPVAVLSGPSFAADVARGLPTAVTLAAGTDASAEALAHRLSTATFRIYAGTDILGVEAGGALKNVMALAAGAAHGLDLGASAGAALVTRGFVELRRLGEALGARPDTLMGLSGLGDLVLTCSGSQSRNFRYGEAMGRGEPLAGLKLAEGAHSAAVAARLAAERGIEAPIVEAVAALVDGRLSAREAVDSLLARPLKREFAAG